jgi:hypothetical protein
MTHEKIEKTSWHGFFDVVSKVLEGRHVDVEVVGIDVGDQIEDKELPLSGITYDAKDDSLYIYLHEPNVFKHAAHRVHSPKEVYVQTGATGLSRVAILDNEGHELLVHFREPLLLPAGAPS